MPGIVAPGVGVDAEVEDAGADVDAGRSQAGRSHAGRFPLQPTTVATATASIIVVVTFGKTSAVLDIRTLTLCSSLATRPKARAK